MTATWDGTPKTWAVGELVTAADMNAELRDRMDWLKAALTSYVRLEDQKASGTAGGTFTQAAWRTRDLNTEVTDTGGLASIAANQITLAAGTWRALIVCPAYACGNHRAQLYNVTDAATLILGQQVYVAAGVGPYARLAGQFVLASSKVVEVQHWCDTTKATTGFGTAGSLGGVEVYTVAEFWRVSE